MKDFPDKLTASEYRDLIKKVPIDKKGRLKFDKVLPEFMDKIIMPSLNKKIRGATKVEQDGVKFDSKLEMAMFNALSSSKLPFTFKETIVLIQGFKYGGKKVQDIRWQPDFFIPYLKIVLDTKGYSNDIAPLKIKLCKYWLFNQGLLDWQIWIVKKKSEIVECIELLKVYKTGQKNKFEV